MTTFYLASIHSIMGWPQFALVVRIAAKAAVEFGVQFIKYESAFENRRIGVCVMALFASLNAHVVTRK